MLNPAVITLELPNLCRTSCRGVDEDHRKQDASTHVEDLLAHCPLLSLLRILPQWIQSKVENAWPKETGGETKDHVKFAASHSQAIHV